MQQNYCFKTKYDSLAEYGFRVIPLAHSVLFSSSFFFAFVLLLLLLSEIVCVCVFVYCHALPIGQGHHLF